MARAWWNGACELRIRLCVHRQPHTSPTAVGMYEHGFDSRICAPDSSHSLFLKGGNESSFGMTLKLPREGEDPDQPVCEVEDAALFEERFRPDSVSFSVRTDNGAADAGHVSRSGPFCSRPCWIHLSDSLCFPHLPHHSFSR